MSEWLNHLHWREPLWLLLALLPLLGMVWRKRSRRDNKLEGFADPPLLPWLLVGEPQRPIKSIALLLAWTLAALAAVGPYWQTKDAAQTEQRGTDIAMIVDISPSMGTADISPTRLERSKRELRDFTALLGNDRLGLVAFSANAYSVLPLTTDHEAFLRFVDLLDPGLTARPGSNLSRALEVAERLLSASAKQSRAIVLISDGEYHDPQTVAAARRLGTSNIPLFVIGVGTESGGPVPDSDGRFMRYQGQVVISHLDRSELQTLAKAGQGAYFDIREDDHEWRDLLAQLRSRTREAAHAASQPPMQGIALYPWLLTVSLILFLWSGARRRDALAMVMLPVLLPLLLIWPSPGEAAPWSEQRAYEALQQGDYAEAQRLYDGVDNYSGQLGLGTAAYRRQEWQPALAAFKRAAQRAGDNQQKAHSLYNAGNALAQLRRFEEASKSYQSALRLQPNLAKAALNLNLVNQFLDAQRGEQQRKDSKQAPLPNAGVTQTDAEQLSRQRRGGDRSAQTATPSAARDKSTMPPQLGSRTERQAGSSMPPPHETPDARLQQTLALWRNSTNHGSGSPELESLQDNSSNFLRRRFREDDYSLKVMIIEGKPW